MAYLNDFPPYPSYSDSGLKAIGHLPSHWKIVRFRDMFSFGKGLSITKENLREHGVPCVNYGEVHSKYGFEVDPKKHPLKCVDEKYLKSTPSALLTKGDLVFADTSEDIEGSGNFTQLSSEDTVFAGYHTVIARPKKPAVDRFLAYLCDSLSYREQVQKRVKGVKVFSITQAILKGTRVWLPDEYEQTAIANFLDQKTAQIDQAIAIKEQQISLLKERKQILIQQAVTRGLNPDAPMRDSGVEWIGEVPKHWEVKPLKFYIKKIIDNRGRTPAFGDQGVPMLEVKNITDGNHYPTEVFSKFVDPKLVLSYERDKVDIGDILISTVGATSGKAVIIRKKPDYFICQNVVGIRMAAKVNRLFASYSLASTYFKTSLMMINKGNTIDNLKVSVFINNPLILPPEQEQTQISEHIERVSQEIDSGVELLHSQVNNLKEYKTTLINSAVTGKIKVA